MQRKVTYVFGGLSVLTALSFGQNSVPGEIIVKTRSGAVPALTRLSILATETTVSSQLKISKIKVAPGSVASALATLRANPEVVFAEPNNINKLILTPNDPSYIQQWGLPNVQAPRAWDIFTGNPSIVIAVIDTGMNNRHEDLLPRLAPGGTNFSEGNNNFDDANGHGTHCAGIAAAASNNGIGIASVGYQARVLPIKIFPNATTENSVKAIQYAADRGAKIISMSYGSYSQSQAEQDAVNYAWNRGCLLFGGAANDNRDSKFYPGECQNVITVGSNTRTDGKSGFSNFGDWVEVSAPGSDIFSTYIGSPNAYANNSGTSMATPFAASVAALAWGRNPSLTNARMRDILIQTVDPIGSWVRFGRVNALKAAQLASPLVAFSSSPVEVNIGSQAGVREGTMVSLFSTPTQAAQSVAAADVTSYTIRSITSLQGEIASIEGIVKITPVVSTIRQLNLNTVFTLPTSVSGLVFVFDYTKSQWVQIGSLAGSGTERTSTFAIPVADIPKYVNSSGHVRTYIRAVQPKRIRVTPFNFALNMIGSSGAFEPVRP